MCGSVGSMDPRVSDRGMYILQITVPRCGMCNMRCQARSLRRQA